MIRFHIVSLLPGHFLVHHTLLWLWTLDTLFGCFFYAIRFFFLLHIDLFSLWTLLSLWSIFIFSPALLFYFLSFHLSSVITFDTDPGWDIHSTHIEAS